MTTFPCFSLLVSESDHKHKLKHITAQHEIYKPKRPYNNKILLQKIPHNLQFFSVSSTLGFPIPESCIFAATEVQAMDKKN